MRYMFIVALLCAVVLAGCGKHGIVAKALEDPKPTPVVVKQENGTIVSNGAIIILSSANYSHPGVIVKLDSGTVEDISLGSSDRGSLKEYNIAYGEKVRCETRNDARVEYYDYVWRLVPREKK